MRTPAAAEFWHVDVRIAGEWRPTPDYERSKEAARNRANAVYHWATVRIRNVISGEVFTREPGRSWEKGEPIAAGAPPSNPRAPLRSPQHATGEQPNYWWREKD